MYTTILNFHNEGALGIVQLATADQDTFQYISSTAAIKENLIAVKEVSAAGSVNSIFIVNHSSSFVFLMDGDILHGAKQNRVLNTSILLAPESKTVVPVSCVEQGRWRSRSARFSMGDYTAPSFIRAGKARKVKESLERKEGYRADQGEVWDGVTFFQMASDVHSKTSNLSDVYDHKEVEMEAFIRAFAADPQANGMGMFIGHDLLSLDIFNRKDIYEEYFARLLRGVALEAFYLHKPGKPVGKAEAGFKVLDFIDRFEDLEKSRHPGVGVGHEYRFDSGGRTGFELRYDNHLIHLTALATGTTRGMAA
ncbi:MAG: hypothetical protein OEM41_04400 [Ignavibacteria bacterium]|nr:hypothetical protein [Ignavibacteria bacterium]